MNETEEKDLELSQQQSNDAEHIPKGGCCADGQLDAEERCKLTCKRNFWTAVLQTVTKVAGLVLAALGLQTFDQER